MISELIHNRQNAQANQSINIQMRKYTQHRWHVKTPSTSATATIIAFEVMIGHNSRTDSAGKSVKTSSDWKDSNRSDEVWKRYLNIWNFWDKCKFLNFRKRFLAILKTIIFTLPCELFRNCFFGLDYVWRPTQKSVPNKVEKVNWSRDFRMKSSGLEKNYKG